jgi:predicted RNase H-like HicB family nuclease
MRYAIVVEKARSTYAAYVPDLPGCIATGATVAETESLIREAIKFHLEDLKEDGLPIPPPSSQVEYVDIPAWDRGNSSSSAYPLDHKPSTRRFQEHGGRLAG